MKLTIVPYAAEHEEAVREFNARLMAKNLDTSLYSIPFPASHIPTWLPKLPGRDLYQEQYLALDEQSVVRGGYILKHHTFWSSGLLSAWPITSCRSPRVSPTAASSTSR